MDIICEYAAEKFAERFLWLGNLTEDMAPVSGMVDGRLDELLASPTAAEKYLRTTGNWPVPASFIAEMKEAARLDAENARVSAIIDAADEKAASIGRCWGLEYFEYFGEWQIHGYVTGAVSGRVVVGPTTNITELVEATRSWLRSALPKDDWPDGILISGLGVHDAICLEEAP